MPSFQYFMVVLAGDSNHYRYLRALNCAYVHTADEIQPLVPEDGMYYRFVYPQLAQPVPLPSQFLCWTNIACVIWDDVLADVLSPQQQQAMLDWLHWGGTLVVSGPGTLEPLQQSFLDPYLPATVAGTDVLDSAALAEFNEYWTVADLDGQRQPLPAVGWSGIRLEPLPGAEFVRGTGRLVAERRVGRGRIVATAFRLHEPQLVGWHSFDSFFNGCILRRPAHRWDTSGQIQSAAAQDIEQHSEQVTALRIFARDFKKPPDSNEPQSPSIATVTNSFVVAPSSADDDPTDVWNSYKTKSGVGGWNDFNSVASAPARRLRRSGRDHDSQGADLSSGWLARIYW